MPLIKLLNGFGGSWSQEVSPGPCGRSKYRSGGRGPGQTDFENDEVLDSIKTIEKSFGFDIAGKAADESRSLTLQTGDTGVAEEMMACTKNNILIQPAQPMLAQANAVPQGVLRLLG